MQALCSIHPTGKNSSKPLGRLFTAEFMNIVGLRASASANLPSSSSPLLDEATHLAGRLPCEFLSFSFPVGRLLVLGGTELAAGEKSAAQLDERALPKMIVPLDNHPDFEAFPSTVKRKVSHSRSEKLPSHPLPFPPSFRPGRHLPRECAQLTSNNHFTVLLQLGTPEVGSNLGARQLQR